MGSEKEASLSQRSLSSEPANPEEMMHEPTELKLAGLDLEERVTEKNLEAAKLDFEARFARENLKALKEQARLRILAHVYKNILPICSKLEQTMTTLNLSSHSRLDEILERPEPWVSSIHIKSKPRRLKLKITQGWPRKYEGCEDLYLDIMETKKGTGIKGYFEDDKGFMRYLFGITCGAAIGASIGMYPGGASISIPATMCGIAMGGYIGYKIGEWFGKDRFELEGLHKVKDMYKQMAVIEIASKVPKYLEMAVEQKIARMRNDIAPVYQQTREIEGLRSKL